MLFMTRRSLLCLSLAFYLLLVAVIFAVVWHKTDGHFCYSIDDPYIHMALAERIRSGLYGLNAGEAASPSSSIVWAYLLVPFVGSSMELWAPFFWNLLFGAVTVAMMSGSIADWQQKTAPKLARPLALLTLVIASGVAGTPFLGMEHGLQVLLSTACAVGICRVLAGRPMPLWCIVAAGLAPLVRYEDFSLTLAVAVTLAGQRRVRSALLLCLASILPIVGFSLYLHRLGLPMLPLSVLVKGNVSETHANVVVSFAKTLITNIAAVLANAKRWPLLALFLLLSGGAMSERARVRRFALAGAAMATGLTLLIVRLGSLQRYEMYAMAFAGLIALHLLWERALPSLTWYALGLMGLALPNARVLPTFAQSAADVYGQQYQMHRFADDFYTGNVGVTDLGEVSYGLGPERYVLDFSGLGSAEAARETNHSMNWMEAIAARRDVGLVMIYQPPTPPATWHPLGRMCLVNKPIEVAEQCVSFYATRAAEAKGLEQSFRKFAKTLPATTFAVFPDRAEEQ